MARKKIDLPITGIGKNPESKLTVQKSVPLFGLWRSGLTLSEFKILDTYLSRINSHDPERRAVVFTKGELEKLLGVKQIKPSDLDDRLKHLQETTVNLFPKGSNRIDRITLFERSQAVQDDSGSWTVEMTCTPSAMKYVFNIDEIGYLRYKLRCITNLTSLYSYILFTYLEYNRFRKEWVVPLDELKELLGCDREETYKQYKRFNDLVLKKVQRELLDKTECRFSYEALKRNRSVIAIRFTVETLAIIEPPVAGQLSLDNYSDASSFFADVLPAEFTAEQVESIRLAALPKVQYTGGVWEMQNRIANYLVNKVARMNASRRPVKHKYNYLLKIISADPDVNDD